MEARHYKFNRITLDPERFLLNMMRQFFYPFFATSFFVLMLGCDEDPAPQDPGPPPKVINVSVEEGSRIPSNSIITVTFDKEMGSVRIDVSCAAGTTTLERGNRKATWMSLPYSPPGFETLPWALWCDTPIGPHTLVITGTDTSGQKLEEFTPVNFVVIGPD